MISGIPASPGIVFGKALVLKEEKIVLDMQKIAKSMKKSHVFTQDARRLSSS